MLKIITALAMSIIGILANAQVLETRELQAFSKIETTDGVEVIFTQGIQNVKAEASDELGLSSISTKVEHGILKISCKGNMGEMVRVYVSAENVKAMEASKKAKITIKNAIQMSTFSLRMASGSTFYGKIISNEVTLAAKTGAIVNVCVESASFYGNFQNNAKVNLSGISDQAEILTSDDAYCAARNFQTGIASIDAKDNSRVAINTKNIIDVKVSETAKVIYYGSPAKSNRSYDSLVDAYTASKTTLIAKN